MVVGAVVLFVTTMFFMHSSCLVVLFVITSSLNKSLSLSRAYYYSLCLRSLYPSFNKSSSLVSLSKLFWSLIFDCLIMFSRFDSFMLFCKMRIISLAWWLGASLHFVSIVFQRVGALVTYNSAFEGEWPLYIGLKVLRYRTCYRCVWVIDVKVYVTKWILTSYLSKW